MYVSCEWSVKIMDFRTLFFFSGRYPCYTCSVRGSTKIFMKHWSEADSIQYQKFNISSLGNQNNSRCPQMESWSNWNSTSSWSEGWIRTPSPPKKTSSDESLILYLPCICGQRSPWILVSEATLLKGFRLKFPDEDHVPIPKILLRDVI